MAITVDFAGEETKEVTPAGETYGDLLAPFDVSKHEVSLLVDGTPVPEDAHIADDVDRVQIVRLIKGG